MSSADPPPPLSLDAPSLPQHTLPPIPHPIELAPPSLLSTVQITPPPASADDVKVMQAAPVAPAVSAAAPSTVAATPLPAALAVPVDKVPFRDLFQFATYEEMWLMRFACVCAAGLGLVFPLFTILFGDLLNGLNGARALADVVSDFSLKFLIIALCAGFGGAVAYGLPVYVAERQMKRVRELYLGSILRQEPAWFDVNKPGEVSSRLAEDTLTWQNGIADKFTQVFSNLVGFVASIVIGFNSNWKIALLVLGIFPAIMVIMIFLKVAIASGEKKASDAYAAAGDCSTEIFNSIRTVAAFCSEAAESKKYLACLVKAKEASKSKGWSMGIAVGSLFFCIYSAYAAGMYEIYSNAPLFIIICLAQVPRWLLDSSGPLGACRVQPLRSCQRRPRSRLRAALHLCHWWQYHSNFHGTFSFLSLFTLQLLTFPPPFRSYLPAPSSSAAPPPTLAPSQVHKLRPSKLLRSSSVLPPLMSNRTKVLSPAATGPPLS